jgi:hypothetical protein
LLIYVVLGSVLLSPCRGGTVTSPLCTSNRARTADLPRRYKFFIGVPLDDDRVLTHHRQGGHDTVRERELEKLLLDEAVKEGDVELLPLRDQYMDLTNKVLTHPPRIRSQRGVVGGD